MRRVAAAAFIWCAAAFLCCAAGGAPAFAFGTINALGQSAEHEKITRAALGDLGPETLDALAGRRGSFGAVGAPDRPGRGLLSQSSAHCDNGDHLDVAGYPQSAGQARAALEACRDWIFAALDHAAHEAGALAGAEGREAALGCKFDEKSGSAKCRALGALGVAFHAAQDFYSHTNWTDEAAPGATGPDNPPGLGGRGRAPFLDPRFDAPFPDGLISGCFKSKPERLFCQYGRPRRDRVRHAALNKDEGPIGPEGALGPGTTPRGAVGANFANAVAAAIEDTRDKWAWFETRLVELYGEAAGARIACLMRNDDPAACGAAD